MQKQRRLFKKERSKRLINSMKVFFLLTLLCVFSVAAENSYSQSKDVSLNVTNITLKEAFRRIEKNTDYLFLIMDESESVLTKNVSVNVNNQSITQLLDQLLRDTPLTYSIVNRQITIYKKKLADTNTKIIASTVETKKVEQTKKTITGKVVDNNGEPIIGANIVEKGVSTNGTISNFDGSFTLNVENNAVIRVTYIGYLDQEIKTAGKTTFHIVMHEDAQALSEVVVVGYGTQKKANLTGAVSSVNVDEVLSSRPIADAGRGLQGTIPGLSVVIPSGEVGADPIMKIRGQIGSIAMN